MEEKNLTKEEATDFFAKYYLGEHHFPGKIKEYGSGWAMPSATPLATYDSNNLTRLVLLAHDNCIRVEISPKGNSRYIIAIWKREREGKIYERHPTMENAIKDIRESKYK